MGSVRSKNKINRICFEVFLLALATTAFIWLWRSVYNPLTVFPYYFKGFAMMTVMYFFLTAFFIWLFNLSQIGYLRKRSVLLSQVLSILIVNFLFYLVTCLLSTYLVPVRGFLILTLGDVIGLLLLGEIFNMVVVVSAALTAAQKESLSGYLRRVYSGNGEELCDRMRRSAISQKKEFLITANPETLMCALENEELDRILLDSDALIIPDGVGLVMARRITGQGDYDKIPGVEFAHFLLSLADEKGLSVFLYGASSEVAGAMARLMGEKYPGARLLGYENGYDKDRDEVMETIAALKPDLVMVALGVPEQEILISRHLGSFSKGIFMGVGGSFDVLSGAKERAPEFFLKYNLEWLYRVSTEPVRLRRFFHSNVRFIWEILQIRKL